MKAKIKEKKYIAEGTLLLVFDLLGKKIDFKPGQFFYLNLINPPYTDEKGNERHFSIVNSPNEKGILKMATRITDSAFKKSLSELPIGTEVKIGPISGNFVFPKRLISPIVFIAGGIGITPFMSMLQYVKENRFDYKISLLYSNRNKESTAFFDEIEVIRKDFGNIRAIRNFSPTFIMTDDSKWSGEKRRINSVFIKDFFINPNFNVYMIAGPPGMVSSVSNSLIEAGVEKNRIQLENFSGY